MYVEGVPVAAAASVPPPCPGMPQLGAPDFAAVLDAAQSSRGVAGPLLDSAALRHLVLSRPVRLEPLSAVQLSPDSFVQRVSCCGPFGERVVLTLRLRRRSAAELASGYSKQPHKQPWVLERVTGEPQTQEPITAVSPEHPPEAVVAASVAAFRYVAPSPAMPSPLRRLLARFLTAAVAVQGYCAACEDAAS